MWGKNTLQLSPASYLARWSTASTMFVPSLALVSQNRAPYACGAKNGHTEDSSVYLESVSPKLLPLDRKSQHTLASFSPCRVLTQLPSGRCSRRSTLFPTTHIGILSSVESCRETEEAEMGLSWPVGSRVWPFCSYLDLIHPRSDAEKAVLWSNVVEEQHSVSFTEVGPGNATKPIENRMISFSRLSLHGFLVLLFYLPLLARRVPYLQAGLFSVHKHALHLKINPWSEKQKNVQIWKEGPLVLSVLMGVPTQRSLNVSSELVQHQPQQEAGLPRSRLPGQNQTVHRGRFPCAIYFCFQRLQKRERRR